jgi:hypothetical protein
MFRAPVERHVRCENFMIEQQSPRQHWKEGMRLLRVIYRKPRKPDDPYEIGDMATLSVRELRKVEREYHEIWFSLTRLRYLRAELRRRALREICLYFSQHIELMISMCSLDHYVGSKAKRSGSCLSPSKNEASNCLLSRHLSGITRHSEHTGQLSPKYRNSGLIGQVSGKPASGLHRRHLSLIPAYWTRTSLAVHPRLLAAIGHEYWNCGHE